MPAYNPHAALLEHLDMAGPLPSHGSCFFGGINCGAWGKKKFYKKAAMGKNALSAIVKAMRKNAGLGHRELTNHSMREFVITSLNASGENIESIVARSAHR